MQRNEIRNDNEDLIRAAAPDERIPIIDVTERVMGRIGAGRQKGGVSAVGYKLASRAGVLTILFTALLVSVSAYAASEWVQIRDALGVVKVQYEPEKNTVQKPAAPPSDPYRKKVLDSAKPGELVAYYEKGQNDVASSSGPDSLKYAYKERQFTSYSDFVKEMQRTGMPLLPERAGGYTFQFGDIAPQYPLVNSAAYRKTLNELINQANTEGEWKRLFTKNLPWTEAGSVNATYADGRAFVGFQMLLLQGSNVKVEQEPGNQTDKFTMAGMTAVYNDVKKENVSYHYLNWYDENKDAFYTLTTYGEHKLSRKQLVRLAEEFINNGV